MSNSSKLSCLGSLFWAAALVYSAYGFFAGSSEFISRELLKQANDELTKANETRQEMAQFVCACITQCTMTVNQILAAGTYCTPTSMRELQSDADFNCKNEFVLKSALNVLEKPDKYSHVWELCDNEMIRIDEFMNAGMVSLGCLMVCLGLACKFHDCLQKAGNLFSLIGYFFSSIRAAIRSQCSGSGLSAAYLLANRHNRSNGDSQRDFTAIEMPAVGEKIVDVLQEPIQQKQPSFTS